MRRRERFVLDTNVLVSALAFPGSTPRKAFDNCRRTGFRSCFRGNRLGLHRTLRRPKLARCFSRAEQDAFLAMLGGEVTIVEVTERIALRRDPRDDRFLEVAIAGGASHLVTGDRDLLALDPFRSTRIGTPAALLTEFASRRR